MERTYKIAVIPGDGIGKEVVPPALDVLDAAATRFGFTLKPTHYDWSCETYTRTGAMMPADGLDQLREHDSILLGAVGWPGVPDHISLWGLLIPIRRGFDQYASVRPCKLMPGARTPLANRTEKDIDFIVVRENTEGEYSAVGGRMYGGTEHEFATQQSDVHPPRHRPDHEIRLRDRAEAPPPARHLRHQVQRHHRHHALLGRAVRRHEAPTTRTSQTAQFHIDILCAHFVQHPDWFDVVVGSNLFGDILSDLGPAVAGSIGIAPSANLNPEKLHPSMFEPVHGSAPDIAGKGIANPIGQIWSAAMMLDHLGEAEAAQCIIDSFEALLREGGPRTRDMGGQAGTADVGRRDRRRLSAARSSPLARRWTCWRLPHWPLLIT